MDTAIVKNKLITLLQASDDIPGDVLRYINEESEQAPYRSILGTYEEIYSLYKLRYRGKKETNEYIPRGLENLITRLENAQVSHLRLHGLYFKEYIFLFFTDEQIQVLFGVIW